MELQEEDGREEQEGRRASRRCLCISDFLSFSSLMLSNSQEWLLAFLTKQN